MKKFVLLFLLVLHSMFGNAQYFEHLYVLDVNTYNYFCALDNDLLGIVVHGTGTCGDDIWSVQNDCGMVVDWVNVDSIVIDNQQHENCTFIITYGACFDESGDPGFGAHFYVYFIMPHVNPFSEPVLWKHSNEGITLSAPSSWHPVWSTGEIDPSITVSEPGMYSVTVTNECGPVTYSVEVRDNVELYRATCNLLTNKNQVTWQITPEQAEYITSVKVYRNTTDLVATVPYTDGSFTDDIGSESTQWQYHLVGVSVEGDDCPIPSYWKRTIHLDHVQGTQGNHILQWTPYEEEAPSKETVAAYAIYDVVNGEAHHVIDVGSFTNVYSYNPSDFSGSAVVAAVFSGRGLEDQAFSNMISMTAVGETPSSTIVVYPNPSNGTFTVEGVSYLTIYNTLGQLVATCRDAVRQVSTSSGTVAYQFILPSGIYFIRSDEGVVRKVVVE